jgi:hypothetical protein
MSEPQSWRAKKTIVLRQIRKNTATWRKRRRWRPKKAREFGLIRSPRILAALAQIDQPYPHRGQPRKLILLPQLQAAQDSPVEQISLRKKARSRRHLKFLDKDRPVERCIRVIVPDAKFTGAVRAIELHSLRSTGRRNSRHGLGCDHRRGDSDARLAGRLNLLERHPVVGLGIVHWAAAQLQRTFTIEAQRESTGPRNQSRRTMG